MGQALRTQVDPTWGVAFGANPEGDYDIAYNSTHSNFLSALGVNGAPVINFVTCNHGSATMMAIHVLED